MSNGDEIEVEVPQEEKAFTELLDKFAIGTKNLKAETIAENISRTGGGRVFEYPERLAERLATWHEYISPVKRKQILEQWFAEKGIEVPEEAIRVAGVKSSEIKTREEEEKKKREQEEKQKAKFFVDAETGVIRGARENEVALTMAEAETISDRIKKEKGKGDKKMPFVIDKDGNLNIKEGADLSREDLFIWDAVSKAHQRGDTRTAREIVEDEIKHFQTMQELTGGKAGKTLFDSIEDFAKFKALFSADEDVKALLSGILKKVSDGESKGETEEVKGLRDELRSLREDLQRKELEKRDDQLKTLTTQLSSLESKLDKATTEARAKDEYGIMSEALKEISNARRDIVGTVQGFIGRRPTPLTETAKKEITEAISEEAKGQAELEKLAEEVFYEHK